MVWAVVGIAGFWAFLAAIVAVGAAIRKREPQEAHRQHPVEVGGDAEARRRHLHVVS